jgi:DNA-binding response OmpR family regulator
MLSGDFRVIVCYIVITRIYMGSRINILILDDEQLITGTLEIILHCYGYQAFSYNSGYRALNAVRSKHFHIALVDIGMPEMNGMEFMAELRNLGTSTKIILMTAHDRGHSLVRQAIAAKPDMLLYKPIDPAKLIEVISYYERVFECTDTPSIE